MAAMIFWMIAFAALALVAAFNEWLVEVAKRRKAASWRKKRQKLKRKRWASA